MNGKTVVKVASAANIVEAEQMVELLEENQISAFRQGGIMDVYMGNSVTGQDIMVLESDREKAEKIIKDFRPIGVNGPMDKRVYPKNIKIIVWILLALVIGFGVVLPLFYL